MSKILVHLYSYKERNLIEFLDVLKSKSSGTNEIKFYVTDQNNLTRLKYFTDKDILYNVVWWDELISPVFHTGKCILENADKGYDYALLLQRELDIPENWDTYLVDNLSDNSVLSGIGEYNVSIKNNFYINRTVKETDKITKTSYLDQSFVFGKYSDIASLEWPLPLKYYGVDEYMSIDLINKGIDIYSLPSDTFKYMSPSLERRGYIPFSLNHNYNDLLDILIHKKSSKLRYQDPSDFIKIHGINTLKLYNLPFDFNDIEYNRSSEFDNTGGKRYIEKLTSVS